jgi:hypothetical protein
MTAQFINIFWAVIGAIVGLTAADIDLAPPLPLKHRSAWTHGPVIPALALLLVQAYPAAWPFAAAFMATYALHLLMDMFPHKWKGSALINFFPVPFAAPPLLSFLYLLGGVAAAVWVGCKIMGWPLPSPENLITLAKGVL